MVNSKGAAKGTTKGYNGYKNYAQWNQSLWISNDEGLYRKACHLVRVFNREDAASAMLEWLECAGISHTPDGVKWSKTGIRAAMVGL